MNIDFSAHNLRERVLKRRQRQRRELLLLCGAFVLVAGLWLWYSMLYTRSPERALEQLQSAVSRHDPSLLEKHADLTQLLTAVCSDLTDTLIDGNVSLTDRERKRCGEFYARIRPQLVQGLEKSVQDYVTSGKWQAPAGSSLMKGRALAVDYERLLERSKLRTTEILSCSQPMQDGQSATALLQVQESSTKVSFELELVLTQQENGLWQVTAINNYRAYLDAVLAKQNKSIADYVAATVDTVQQGNGRLGVLERRFYTIVRQAGGRYGQQSIEALTELINEEIIPCLRARQASLDAVPPPPGAEYLAGLRQQSTQLDIAAWRHFLAGISQDNRQELDKAESLKKQVLETELRIEDIIKRRTLSQAPPQLS